MQTRTRGRVCHRALRRARADAARRLSDARQSRNHDGVGRERPARGIELDIIPQTQRVAQDQLLVGERGVQLRKVDRPLLHTRFLGRQLCRGRAGQVAYT